MKKDYTYLMLKPIFAEDRDLVKKVRNMIKEDGFDIENEGMVRYDIESAQRHYVAHINKPFYPSLEDYITSGPAYGFVCFKKVNEVDYESGKVLLDGRNIVKNVRTLVEDRPYFNKTQNGMHGSDERDAAQIEIEIFKSLRAKEQANENEKNNKI